MPVPRPRPRHSRLRRHPAAIHAALALALGATNLACADPGRAIVARSYRYSNILLGGGEMFATDRYTANVYRREETGRTTYSVDVRGGANLVGFDLVSIPDSLSTPDRIDLVTLVNLSTGAFEKCMRGSRSELRYAFDPAHIPTCDPDPMGLGAKKRPPAPRDFEFVGTDRIAGRAARHYRSLAPVDGPAFVLAKMARDLVGADSTTTVRIVSDVWTCAPDPLLTRWVDATQRFPQLDELGGFKRGESRPVVCRGAPTPLVEVLGPGVVADPREIRVATDLSLEVELSPADTAASRRAHALEYAPGAAGMPIVFRGHSLYIARDRLLSVDEEPIAPELLAAPRGYHVTSVPTASGSTARPPARPTPTSSGRTGH